MKYESYQYIFWQVRLYSSITETNSSHINNLLWFNLVPTQVKGLEAKISAYMC